MTPNGRPFYAGTYFPPEPRSGMPSFRQVLAAVREAWIERRGEVDGTADAVTQALAEARSSASTGGQIPSVEDLAAAAAAVAARETASTAVSETAIPRPRSFRSRPRCGSCRLPSSGSPTPRHPPSRSGH
ncbi:DUF255 domain-containing protein [Microbacterium terregens]|uniref:DUF255 domain-containing protein n=1 Tax=Microbacterium terregens TaxID=69363 RepID=UPI0031D9FAF1